VFRSVLNETEGPLPSLLGIVEYHSDATYLRNLRLLGLHRLLSMVNVVPLLVHELSVLLCKLLALPLAQFGRLLCREI
jgi:hypothetical protein